MTNGKRLFVFLLPISLVLAAAGASGCGSSGPQEHRLSKSEYRQKLIEIMSGKSALEATRLFGEIVVGDSVTGPKPLQGDACAKSTREFATSLHEIVRSVAALNPPNEVAALQSRFLKEARTSMVLVDKAARDAQAGRLACGQEMNDRIYGLLSTERAEAIVKTLREKDYLPSGD